MALLFMRGFDHEAGFTDLLAGTFNAIAGSANNFSLVAGRFGGKALEIDSGSGNDTVGIINLPYAIASGSPIYVGAAFNMDGNTGAGGCIVVRSGGLNNQSYIVVTPTTVTAYRSNAGVTAAPQQSSNGLALGGVNINALTGWNYFEVEFVVHATAGSVVVKMNGAQILNLTAQNTLGDTSSSTIAAVGVGSGQGGLFVPWIDDIYACDSTGSVANTFLGDVQVQTLFPTANTTPL